MPTPPGATDAFLAARDCLRPAHEPPRWLAPAGSLQDLKVTAFFGVLSCQHLGNEGRSKLATLRDQHRFVSS